MFHSKVSDTKPALDNPIIGLANFIKDLHFVPKDSFVEIDTRMGQIKLCSEVAFKISNDYPESLKSFFSVQIEWDKEKNFWFYAADLNKLDQMIQVCLDSRRPISKPVKEKILLDALPNALKSTAKDRLPFFNEDGKLVCTVRDKQLVGVETIVEYVETEKLVISKRFLDQLNAVEKCHLLNKQPQLLKRLSEEKDEKKITTLLASNFIDFFSWNNLSIDLIKVITHPLLQDIVKLLMIYQLMGFNHIPKEFKHVDTLAGLKKAAELAVERGNKIRVSYEFDEKVETWRSGSIFEKLERMIKAVDRPEISISEDDFKHLCSIIEKIRSDELKRVVKEGLSIEKLALKLQTSLEVDARWGRHRAKQLLPHAELLCQKIEERNNDFIVVEYKEYFSDVKKEVQKEYCNRMISFLEFCLGCCRVQRNHAQLIIKLISMLPPQVMKEHHANAVVEMGLVDVLKEMVNKGFDLHAGDKNLLMHACKKNTGGSNAMLKYLVDQGVPFLDLKTSADFLYVPDLLAQAEIHFLDRLSDIMRMMSELPINTRDILGLVFTYIVENRFIPDPNKVLSLRGLFAIRKEIDAIGKHLLIEPDQFKTGHYELFILRNLFVKMQVLVENPDTTLSDFDKTMQKEKEELLKVYKNKGVTQDSISKLERRTVFPALLEESRQTIQKRCAGMTIQKR